MHVVRILRWRVPFGVACGCLWLHVKVYFGLLVGWRLWFAGVSVFDGRLGVWCAAWCVSVGQGASLSGVFASWSGVGWGGEGRSSGPRGGPASGAPK